MRLLATPLRPATDAVHESRWRPRAGLLDQAQGFLSLQATDRMFDPTWLFLSLIPGGVGFVLFVYGKKQERWPQLAAGIAFMVYPYFTDTVTALIVVGAVLGAALWLALRSGW